VISAGVRARLREREQGADKKLLAAELANVGRELDNAIDALVSLGKSAAVLARVRELESRKAALESQLRTIDKPVTLVPNVERRVIARIEQLEQAARDPSTATAYASQLMAYPQRQGDRKRRAHHLRDRRR